MEISKIGLEAIKQFEGCKLYAYRDSVGVATIGFGHTRGVKMGMAINMKQAEQFLRDDLALFEKSLNALHMNFTQGQFDALCSFTFNLGITNFLQSTLLKKIRAHAPVEDIQYQFRRWNKAGGKVLPGLTKRRDWEAKRWAE